MLRGVDLGEVDDRRAEARQLGPEEVFGLELRQGLAGPEQVRLLEDEIGFHQGVLVILLPRS